MSKDSTLFLGRSRQKTQITQSMHNLGQYRRNVAARAREVCQQEFDGNESAMARAIDVSQSKMNRVLNLQSKTATPYEDLVEAIHQNLGYPVSELIGSTSITLSQGDGEDGMVRTSTSRIPSSDLIEFQAMQTVTFYDVRPRAGSIGEVPLDEYGHSVELYTFLLRKIIGASLPAEIGMFRLEGDSMAPEVRSHALVFFTPADHVPDAGRYVISVDGELLLKKVQRRMGGIYRIIPANPDYDSEDIQQQGETFVSLDSGATVNFRIVGRFLASLHPQDLDADARQIMRFLAEAGVISGKR